MLVCGALLCSDGKWIAWPHSEARSTYLRSDRVRALLSSDPLERVLAHHDLPSGAIVSLFGATPNKLRRARYLRRCAARIVDAGLHDSELVRGLGENQLVSIFRASSSREQLIRLLLDAAREE